MRWIRSLVRKSKRLVAATSALYTLQTRDLCNLAAPGVQDRARADER